MPEGLSVSPPVSSADVVVVSPSLRYVVCWMDDTDAWKWSERVQAARTAAGFYVRRKVDALDGTLGRRERMMGRFIDGVTSATMRHRTFDGLTISKCIVSRV